MSTTRTKAIYHRAIALAAIASVATVAIGYAATHEDAPRAATAVPPVASPYLPSISDLMIETIQPRHERLWRAEQDGNWDFAAYELGNLRGAFRRLGAAHPAIHAMSLPDMIASVTEQPFSELGSAVQAKDDAAFVRAYTGLTGACNACHQALGHGVVAIHVPGAAGETDWASKAPSRN